MDLFKLKDKFHAIKVGKAIDKANSGNGRGYHFQRSRLNFVCQCGKCAECDERADRLSALHGKRGKELMALGFEIARHKDGAVDIPFHRASQTVQAQKAAMAREIKRDRGPLFPGQREREYGFGVAVDPGKPGKGLATPTKRHNSPYRQDTILLGIKPQTTTVQRGPVRPPLGDR